MSSAAFRNRALAVYTNHVPCIEDIVPRRNDTRVKLIEAANNRDHKPEIWEITLYGIKTRAIDDGLISR